MVVYVCIVYGNVPKPNQHGEKKNKQTNIHTKNKNGHWKRKTNVVEQIEKMQRLFQ